MLQNLQIMDSEEGQPIQMAIEVWYDGAPEVDLVLKGAKGSFISEHMPMVDVDLHWIQAKMKLIAELSFPTKECKVWFAEKPTIKWDLTIDATKLHIPIPIEGD